MILLEPGNRVLADTVADKLKPSDPTAKRDPIDVRLCDFDDVTYRVVIDPNSRNLMQVSMSIPCWNEIKDAGVKEILADKYAGLVVDPAQGFDVTLQFDFDKLPASPDALIEKVRLLKTNVVGGVFSRFLTNMQKGGSSLEPFKFNLRADTQVYLISGTERVTVIFQVDFNERVDIAVAKVFLQEFEDSRRHLGQAPVCTFNVNPPLEMKAFGITEPQGKLGFLSFTLLKNHVDSQAKLDRAVAALQTFRNYLQYHIKCAKSYFHARMRARVTTMLKVLNRAKQEQDDQPKRLLSGKFFVRKDR